MKIYFKIIITYVIRAVLCLLKLFPIKNNRVVFCSWAGEGYNCNPMYLSKCLQDNYDGKFEIIWLFKYPYRKEYEKAVCTKVKYRSFKGYLYLLTAKFVVINTGCLLEVPRRKGVNWIQTWHGGGCYKRGLMHPSSSQKKLDKMYNERCCYFVASCKAFEIKDIRGDKAFLGEVLETGLPRNDFLVKQEFTEIRRRVLYKLHIKESAKIVLFAPTWRENHSTTIALGFAELKAELQRKFGGEWIVLLRMHHLTEMIDGDMADAIDVTGYSDMQELLAIADVLISDYSSCVWDYSYTYRPCFLYCEDLEDYIGVRHFHFPVPTWGFPVCYSADELYHAIQMFQSDEYVEKVKRHHVELGSFEMGNAAEQICKKMYEESYGKAKEREET